MGLPSKATVSRPLAEGYGVLIEYGDDDAESLYLPLAVGPNRQMVLETVPPEERSPTTAENPEDMRAESGRPFSRSTFSGGEGLDFAHRRNSTDRDWARYWDSRNVEVTPARRGELSEVKLLHSTSSLRAADASGTAFRFPLVRVGSVLYGMVSDIGLVDRTADPTASSPPWTTEDPGGTGTIRDLAALGDEVYACQDAIYQRNSAGTWTSWSNLFAERLWPVKGRILASNTFDGDELYEARSGSGSVLLHTLAPGEQWNDVVDAGSAILAAASDGLVYAFTEENGELVLQSQQPIAEGETPTALGFSQGLVFVGTAQSTSAGGQIGRLWRAVIVGVRLRDGAVLRTWGDGSTTVDRSPKRIIDTRDSVWTAVVEDGSETHLWRYHLETGGISRDLIFGASGVVHGIESFDDRIFATVLDAALYREDTTYADEGWLIGPLGDFYNAAAKAWVGARLEVGARPTDTSVALAYTTTADAIEDPDHASWTTIVTFDESTAPTSDESAITEVESRFIAGKVTLTPNPANTATPTVLGFAFRGLADITEDEYRIPVNLSDRREVPGRKSLEIPGVGDAIWNALQGLKGQAATVTVLRPSEIVDGQIRGLSVPIESLTPISGSATVYGLLTVRGVHR